MTYSHDTARSLYSVKPKETAHCNDSQLVVKLSVKRCVFNCRLKTASPGDVLMSCGKPFLIQGTATQNAQYDQSVKWRVHRSTQSKAVVLTLSLLHSGVSWQVIYIVIPCKQWISEFSALQNTEPVESMQQHDDMLRVSCCNDHTCSHIHHQLQRVKSAAWQSS